MIGTTSDGPSAIVDTTGVDVGRDGARVAVRTRATNTSANGPLLVVDEDTRTVAHRAADEIVAVLRRRLAESAHAVWVPSTGATTDPIFAALRDRHRDALPWRRVRVVQMDELLGVAARHAASTALVRDLIGPLGIGAFVPLSTCFSSAAASLERADEAIARLGLDLVLHGLGENGHLGYNEPGTPLDGESGLWALQLPTRRALARRLGLAPQCGITLGLATLSGARSIILVATGAHKRRALRRALFGTVRPACPASSLQRHGQVQVFCDASASPIDGWVCKVSR